MSKIQISSNSDAIQQLLTLLDEKPKFDKVAYDSKYVRDHYDQVMIRFPKGYKGILKQAAKERGMSVNRLILRAVSTYFSLETDGENNSKTYGKS